MVTNMRDRVFRRIETSYTGNTETGYRSYLKGTASEMKKTSTILFIVGLLVIIVSIFACSAMTGDETVSESDTTDSGTSTTDPQNDTTSVVTSGTAETTVQPESTTGNTQQTQPPVTDENGGNDVPDEERILLSVSSSDIYTGSLILVNSSNPYCYKIASLYTPGELDKLSASALAELGWTSLYNNKTGNFLLRSRLIFMRTEAYSAFELMMQKFVAVSGHKDVQVRYAYQLTDSSKDPLSLSDERVSGLSVEINVLTDEGSFSIDHISKKSEYYDWFAANCHKYGFIMTGESGYFRYVGIAHATYMQRNGLSLDKYLSFIKYYGYENPLSVTDDDGRVWEIYYSVASGTSMTEIPVDKGHEYSVSGNNSDGFVISVLV